MADQYVTIACHAPRLTVRALMDTDAPTITQGYGGFQEIQRPGRRSLVAWQGVAPYRMGLALVFDGRQLNLPARDRLPSVVETDCANLERMASMPQAFWAPPKVRVTGAAVPKSSLDWHIDVLTWGEALRSRDGLRNRQHVTLELVQAVTGAGVRVSAVSNRSLSGRSVILAHPGGSVALQRLASRELGSAKRWKEIAKLNGIRTPAKVKAGTALRLP
jgi:hypothetical protein